MPTTLALLDLLPCALYQQLTTSPSHHYRIPQNQQPLHPFLHLYPCLNCEVRKLQPYYLLVHQHDHLLMVCIIPHYEGFCVQSL